MFVDDLITLAVAAGVGAFGTTIFASSKAVIPNGVGGYLSIIETGGTSPMRVHNSLTNPYGRPSAQVVARASTHPVARTLIWNAYNAFLGKYNFWVSQAGGGNIWFVELNPEQEPFDLGLDDLQRLRYAFNVRAIRQHAVVP